MKTYEKYKDSGAEWIGDIPAKWSLKKLKFVVNGNLKYGANESAEFEDNNNPRYIRITDFGEDGKLRDDTFKSLPLEVAEGYLLSDGDILFARSGATVGKTFQFKNYKGLACHAGYLIKASPDEKQITSDFLYYYTKSRSYENWRDSIFMRATIQNIGADKYSVLKVPIPDLDEQTSIAEYLDKETERIDEIVEKKKRLIELLKEERQAIINQAVTRGINPDVKLKPSGIEWLGDIPAHWKTRRLKYVANIQVSNVDKKSHDNETAILLCNYVDVYKNEFIDDAINFMEATASENEIHKFLIKAGDVIITKDSETPDDIANPALAIKDFENVICAYHLAQIRPDRVNLIGEFLLRLFQTKTYTSYFEVAANGVTRYGMPLGAITGVWIPLPPRSEQDAICHEAKIKTGKIDATISKIAKEIDLIKEYRTALISEVVTGKIKVV